MSQTVSVEVSNDLLQAVKIARPFLAESLVCYQKPDRTNAIVAEMAEHLYTYWFTRAGNTLQMSRRHFEYPILPARLRAIHAATNQYESGWTVIAIHGRGAITVERLGEQLTVVPPDYANITRLAVPVRLGDSVAVIARRDYLDYENGWWMSDGRVGAAPVDSMIRVYWNCPVNAVITLIAHLTEVLERSEVAYTLKCPIDESLFGRIDGVVIYLSPDSFYRLKPQLRDVHREIAQLLNDHVPPFTLRLGRGAAVAEDPSNGQSFGQSRCEAVATELIRANKNGVKDDTDLAHTIIVGLEAHGISSERPYLTSSSAPDLVTPW